MMKCSLHLPYRVLMLGLQVINFYVAMLEDRNKRNRASGCARIRCALSP